MIKTRSIKIPAVSALIILFTVVSAFSQAGRGKARVGGVVLDSEGKPVADAKIVVSNIENPVFKVEDKTNKKGEWSLIGLGSGAWAMMTTAKGFLPDKQVINVTQLQINPKITVILKKPEKTTSALIEDESTLQLLDQANQFFKDERYDSALSLFQEFLQKNPAAYQALISMGDCHRQKGDIEKAIECYQRAIEESKKDSASGKVMAAKAQAGIGNCYMKQGKLKEAQEFFRRSIENSPQDEVLAYNVGEIYFSNQNADEALKYFTLAAQIKPDWADPYLKLGYVYLNKADNGNAIAKFEKFLTIEPESERATQVKSLVDMLKKK